MDTVTLGVINDRFTAHRMTRIGTEIVARAGAGRNGRYQGRPSCEAKTISGWSTICFRFEINAAAAALPCFEGQIAEQLEQPRQSAIIGDCTGTRIESTRSRQLVSNHTRTRAYRSCHSLPT